MDLAVRTPEKVLRLALGDASHDAEFGVDMDLADDFGLVGTLLVGDDIIVRGVREHDVNRLGASIANVGTTAAACSPPWPLTAQTANYCSNICFTAFALRSLLFYYVAVLLSGPLSPRPG